MLVEQIGYRVAGRVDNAANALEIIFSRAPDVILMDIDIKGALTGLEIAERIKHLGTPILFITSFADQVYYERAKNTHMAGYLVKPTDEYSLRTAIHLAMQNVLLRQQSVAVKPPVDPSEAFILEGTLFFKQRDIYVKVELHDILYVHSDDKYCRTIVQGGTSYLARLSLNQMELLLPQHSFMRTHRQYILNLKQVASFNFVEGTAQISDKELPINRATIKTLRDKLQLLS